MNTKPKIAFIYGGQGAQHLTMADELLTLPLSQTFFQAMEDSLKLPLISWFHSKAHVHSTQSVQILIFLVQEAWTQMLLKEGITPHAVAGQSLGEYNALLTAKVSDLKTLAHLVKERGAAMAASLHPKTVMKAALGNFPTPNDVLDLPGLYLANDNGPKQMVIGGEEKAFEAMKTLPQNIKRLIPLNTEAAFHTPYMAPAKARLTPLFSQTTYATPVLDLYQNISGQKTTQITADNLLDHLVSPVRFGPMIQNMVQAGIDWFIEISPSSQLQRLIQQNAPNQTVYSVNSLQGLAALKMHLKGEKNV